MAIDLSAILFTAGGALIVVGIIYGLTRLADKLRYDSNNTYYVLFFFVLFVGILQKIAADSGKDVVSWAKDKSATYLPSGSKSVPAISSIN